MAAYRFSRLIAVTALAGTLAACQTPTVEELLFSPTYTTRSVPITTGTNLDCRSYRDAGRPGGAWRALVGGRMFRLGDTQRNVSREACFSSQQDCNRFLGLMSGYIDMVLYSRCEPY